MKMGFKTLLFTLTMLTFFLYLSCQLPAPASENSSGEKPQIESIWKGISHSNVSGNNNIISLIVYGNDTFEGSTDGADFTIDFKGGGKLSPAFNINGTGTITTTSSGSDTFLIYFTGTMSDTEMSGTYTVDYTTFPDDSGTFYLVKDGSSSHAAP